MADADRSSGDPNMSTDGDSERPNRRHGWLGVLIAAVVAGLVLLFLLLPNVLLYPPVPEAPEQPDYSVALEAQRATNEALEEEIARLEDLLGAGVCRLDGDLMIPRDLDPELRREGSLEPIPDEDLYTPADFPPTPDATRIERSAEGAEFEGSLIELLDRSTVLVMADTAEGGVSFGSGFAVGPDRVLTNHHVVADARPNGVFISNQEIGGAHQAEVESLSPGYGFGQRDYALLRVLDVDDLEPFHFHPAAARLSQVIAAGFPTLIIESDSNFQDLIRGDRTAVPAMAVTEGIVTVTQNPETLALVGHTADISPGNSGGPLVDMCGRVIGINTFIRTGPESMGRINYALRSDDVAAFLADAGLAVVSDDADCAPQVMIAEADTGEDPDAEDAPDEDGPADTVEDGTAGSE